jgi:transcription-repair coupling factor (superfamily II helicase)
VIEHINSLSFQALLDKVKNRFSVIIDNVDEAQIATTIAYIENHYKKNILIISSDRKKDLLYKNLSSNTSNLLEFLSWETLLFEEIKPSSDVIGNRFETLNALIKAQKSHTLICTIHSLLQKIIPPQTAKDLFLTIKIKDIFEFEDFIQKIDDLGYEKASIVSDKAQFSIRGGIIDIYPTNLENPYRIEFFGDEIESIRIFDLTTQKSIKKVDFINIYPADELKLIKKEENLTTILSYLSDDYIVIFDDLYQIEENLISLNIKSSKYFLSFDEFLSIIENKEKIYFSEKKIEDLCFVTYKEKETYFQNIDFEIFKKKLNANLWLHPFLSYFDFLKEEKIENILDFFFKLTKKKFKFIFLTSNDAEKKHLLELLKEKNITIDEDLIFETGFLSSGYIISDLLLCIVPYNEITHRKVIRRQKFREAYQTPYSEYHHLEIGDLVVHYHSGIGKYIGCEKHSNHLGIDTEFLIIEYAQNSKLYVPLSQAHLISRYIGSTDEIPTLSQLGSSKWQKTKLTAQRQIIGYASDLLNIQAQRELEGGFQYPLDSEETQLFDMDFPYVETKDQLKAIEEIKNDMMSKKAMDRLICGDVGYGKTEVAMRAAFKAVYDGKKQIAVLVPTTVLAMQHLDSFKERMSSFPINIEVVSRFKTTKQNKQILDEVAKGKIDILIGTHRLLSQDVYFKDLGLIIIDEEQRFGVRAKEHLKKFKKGVDCLTLSATPIPRTLYMSLIKVKDISIINTPPQDRLPIKTIIAENDDEIIKNALLRELARQGQVFFIHNRIETIYKRYDHVKNLIPNAKISIVHGQMPTEEVDIIFHKFKQNEIDILFSTTIIENGIDVPNANTIIIDKADTFGLADLYQLRGRVGRWNRAAYAYFLTPKNKQISEISQKRLHALLEAPGFGGGMKIAMRDLELRGAGDILGLKQSGQVSNIGFHLYCKLLKKAITSLKNRKEASFIETKIEFPYPAFLPENYVPHANLRMEIYYRLGEAQSYDIVDQIGNELKDRFGSLPTEVIELLNLTKIRIFANQNNFIYLKFGEITLLAEKLHKNKKIQKTLILPKKIDIEEFKQKVINILKENFYIQ